MEFDAKAAVKKAMSIAAEFLPDKQLSLEEVQVSDDGQFWLITVGYPGRATAFIVSGAPNKEYKVIKLWYETGEFHSMVMRKPD